MLLRNKAWILVQFLFVQTFFVGKIINVSKVSEYSNIRGKLLEKSKLDKAVFELQAQICKTLANPTRLMIIHTLRDGEKSVGELAAILGLRQANLSQHLTIMRQTQILKTRKQGSSIYYSLANPKINNACDMVREVLVQLLDQKQQLSNTLASH
jgi:ArsR family transcriptional regulator, virulence genes transcriptional regulator